MVKVIIRRASTGVAAASTLLVATSAGGLGCVADIANVEDPGKEPVTEADLAVGSGAAVIELGYSFGQPTEFGFTVQQTTTDEFIRVGESLTLSIPAWLLWQKLYPQDPLPDAARLMQLQGSMQIRFYDKALAAGSIIKPIASYSGVDPNDLDALTDPFTIPAKTDSITITITITDEMNPGVSAQIPATTIQAVPVFGGELPKKTLFFDSSGVQFRQRIIEGDSIVAGSSMLLAYADWRADTLVNKTSIDTQIGKVQSATRFGMVTVPIYGRIEHQVSFSIFFNDRLGWRPEAPLPPTTTSSLLAAGRTSFQAQVAIPAKGSKMSLYVHVKSFLIADYSAYNNIVEKWYPDNATVLKADKYDNPYGPFTNYDYNLQN